MIISQRDGCHVQRGSSLLIVEDSGLCYAELSGGGIRVARGLHEKSLVLESDSPLLEARLTHVAGELGLAKKGKRSS